MKECKVTIDGKERVCQISDEQIKQLTEKKGKTGYERAKKGDVYYCSSGGKVTTHTEIGDRIDDRYYKTADYYSDKKLARDNAKFYNLHRQLKRFAVENRVKDLDCGNYKQKKWEICFKHDTNALLPMPITTVSGFGVIAFDSIEKAFEAIELFHDELIWYFTEYNDSL